MSCCGGFRDRCWCRERFFNGFNGFDIDISIIIVIVLLFFFFNK